MALGAGAGARLTCTNGIYGLALTLASEWSGDFCVLVRQCASFLFFLGLKRSRFQLVDLLQEGLE